MRILKVIVVLAVVCTLAAVAYKRAPRQPEFQHPLAVELERLRADAQRLHADVCQGVASLGDVQSTLGETMDSFADRVAGIQRRTEAAQAELAKREKIAKKYSTLLERNRGAILPDGQYVSPDVVHQQYDFEKDQVEALRRELLLLNQHRENAERIHLACLQRHEKTNTTLAGLRAAQSQLEEQLAHLDLMLQAFANEALTESTFEGDVRRLQGDITSIQDELDVYLHELPEMLALERAEPNEILLPN